MHSWSHYRHAWAIVKSCNADQNLPMGRRLWGTFPHTLICMLTRTRTTDGFEALTSPEACRRRLWSCKRPSSRSRMSCSRSRRRYALHGQPVAVRAKTSCALHVTSVLLFVMLPKLRFITQGALHTLPTPSHGWHGACTYQKPKIPACNNLHAACQGRSPLGPPREHRLHCAQRLTWWLHKRVC